ncbi:inactive histone-lysine N-methyltransferase 2E-like isoform X2 [Ornithodoros turicata]|uniref:inactive histone-lysine N-methyltransferase 2E-like isoform X2 n=1 Tax=Ornithodoros turicata TaxID=34597 RepID=UPI0031389E53
MADGPPQVDEASLQQAMDKNKESLKVKLMLRRPISELVDQGIMPSLKTSPAFHEQRKSLERAKMGDYLKNKIQRRPDRQELIQQHILEDTTVDPSLQDKQRQLKKARLADGLNDRLSHRPGPLELIKGNILQTDESFAQAVKEGQIPFRRTCEGETRKHPPPFVTDEDSEGSDSLAASPDDQSQSSLPSVDLSEASSVPSPESQPTTLCPSHQLQYLGSNVVVATPTVFLTSGSTHVVQPAGGGKAARKKSKSKSQPKARTIKFHEYKGPPNAQKNHNSVPSSTESSYELLLQQQQLFLQWQLEWQQKYPQIILPAHKPVEQQSPPPTPQPHKFKLEDMKVSDLKAELKRRNLPVSGSKPQLIERLKPHTDGMVDKVEFSPQSPSFGLDSSPPVPMEVDDHTQESSPPQKDLKERCIEELQQELQRSQPVSYTEAGANLSVVTTPSLSDRGMVKPADSKAYQRQLIQQHLQNKIQQAASINPISSSQSSAAVKASLANFLHSNSHAIASNNQGNVHNGPRLSPKQTDGQHLAKQPPDYTEATKHLVKKVPSNTVKSQDMDDVLEILIKNGELPPSAAQDPPDNSFGVQPPFPTPPPSSEASLPGPPPETPPPSASLDFDFHLDIDDLDSINVLGCNGEATKSLCNADHDPALNMEMELSDWLDVMMPRTANLSESTSMANGIGTSSTSNHDPLLSTNANDDPFDFFATDDVDLRSWDFRNTWDNADFIA